MPMTYFNCCNVRNCVMCMFTRRSETDVGLTTTSVVFLGASGIFRKKYILRSVHLNLTISQISVFVSQVGKKPETHRAQSLFLTEQSIFDLC